MSFVEKYKNLNPGQKRMAMGVGVGAIILGVSVGLTSLSERKNNRTPFANKPEVDVVSPQRTTGVEGFNAELQALRKSQEEMRSKYEKLLREKETKVELEPEKIDLVDLVNVDEPFPEITAQTDVFNAPVNKGADLPEVPTKQANTIHPPQAATVQMPEPVQAAPSRAIRVVSQEGELGAEEVEQKLNVSTVKPSQKTPSSAFIPAGSMFSGVVLTGLDAPTSGVAQKNPTPVVIRVKREAVLPNYASIDVRECFVVASGYGQLSTERALMRAETLSCVRNDGQVIENAIDAYIVGTDGKVGIPGRLVSKQGQMIAQTLMAGALGGIGQALSRSRVPSLNIDPSKGDSLYESESVSSIMQSGVSGGLGSATNMIAKFYLDMAKETFPVVEVPAGEVVTIVITRGSNLPLKGSTDLQKISEGNSGLKMPVRQQPSNKSEQQPQAPAEAAIKAMNVIQDGSKNTQNFSNGLGW